jgi:hypothetical protein
MRERSAERSKTGDRQQPRLTATGRFGRLAAFAM